jgi:hypothetical protein
MELLKFINDNKITNFNTLKGILEIGPFNLKIKEDIDKPNLFLIHNTETSNFDIKLVRECNGIILEKNTYKIICYTFDKCIDSNLLENINIDFDNLYYESAVEGTLIRLFYYNNIWNVCTKKCIDASKSRWISNKNFTELFNECIQKYDSHKILESLNPSYCYSFIIVHPENNIIVKYQEPDIFHISTRDMNTLNEIDIILDIPKLEKKKIEKDNINNILNFIQLYNTLDAEGSIFIDTNYNRHKVRIPYFTRVREIWGNTNNRMMRYLELRKNSDTLNEYLSYFPYDRDLFIIYENHIGTLAKDILNIYNEKHIKKNNIRIPYFFAKSIYKLHGNFINNKIYTDYCSVMIHLLELQPKNIMFMIKHREKYINSQENVNNLNNEEKMEEDGLS